MLVIPNPIINNLSMTSGSHLSKDLHDMIKSIGQTRSKEQEDKIIIAELANLKPKLSETNIPPKKMKQLLIKALYIQMLGHNAQIAHIEALKLTQSKNLSLKRVGYLLCSLFFNQESDLLIMLTSTIQKDLMSTNINEVVICLTSLPKIINSTIANAVGDSVIKLLTHQTDLVRKKALLVVGRIQQISPGFINDYNQKLKNAIVDREPSVMASSLSLYYQLIKANPQKYKDMTPSFVIILKQIIQHKLPKEFDYHKVPAPWIQIKLLKLIALLGKNDLKASQHCYSIVSQALEKRISDNNVNVGFALLYQCVLTIATIYPNQNLLQSAAVCVSKFLQSTSNNLKYMGITLLSAIFKNYPKILQEHQITVIDCLQSKDETLRNQTLQLLAKMTNNNNINVIIVKMLESLNKSTDPYFRNNLVNKISDLTERFAPSKQWYIDNMHTLFEFGSEFIKEDVLNNYLKSVEENYQEHQDFGTLIVQSSLDLLGKVTPTDLIAKAVSWVCGEIGSKVYSNDKEKLHQIALMLLQLLKADDQKDETKVWIINALDKLSSNKVFQMHQNVKTVLEENSLSNDLELSVRAIESRRLAKYNAALRMSQSLNFDKNLNFLKNYVNAQRQQGAPQYNKNFSITMEDQNIGLNFGPYQLNNQGKSSSSNTRTDKDALISTGPERWTQQGYIPNKNEQKPQSSINPSSKTMTGIGSNTVGSQNQTTYVPAKKEEQPKQDPNKKKLANELFGGFGKKPLIGPGSKKPETKPLGIQKQIKKQTMPKVVAVKKQTKPASNSKQQKVQEIDLLSL